MTIEYLLPYCNITLKQKPVSAVKKRNRKVMRNYWKNIRKAGRYDVGFLLLDLANGGLYDMYSIPLAVRGACFLHQFDAFTLDKRRKNQPLKNLKYEVFGGYAGIFL